MRVASFAGRDLSGDRLSLSGFGGRKMKSSSRVMTCAYAAAALLGLAVQIPAQQTAYYVSPSGDDANSGSEAKPFKSLAAVRDAVRAANANMTQDILVYLRAGTYHLDQTFRLEAKDSGTNGHNVVYRSYHGEKVQICGGRPITGWEHESGNVWRAKTDLADFRQLYVNGVRAVRARGGPLPGAELFGGNGYETTDGRMATWGNPSDIEFIYDVEWERTICKVAKITQAGSSTIVTMQQPYFTLARIKDGIRVTFPTSIENARELLDEPGEFYLDKHTHTVYYIPRPGEDLNSAEVIAPAVPELLRVEGTLDAPVHNIRFEGVTFCHATWLKPSEVGLIDVQANFVISPQNLVAREGGAVANLHNEQVKSPSNIVLHAAKSVRFERCTFTHLGSGGIDIEYGSQDNVISGSQFHDISGSAVQVGDVIDHHPKDRREVVKNNQVTNNYIHDVAIQYLAGVGVFAGYTEGTVIAHNEIRNLPYSAISVGWGWGEEDAGGGAPNYWQPFFYKEPTVSRGLRCEYNHIHNVMLQRNDGGGIYTLGMMPGSVIRGNVVHDNVGRPGGIYLDEGSAYIEVTGNSVYNVYKSMNYNNRSQNRIATCHEHDNDFDLKPTDRDYPQAVAAKAGLEPAYRDLLESGDHDRVH